jgi:hypothetical protein
MPKRKPTPDEAKGQAVVVIAGFVQIVCVLGSDQHNSLKKLDLGSKND